MGKILIAACGKSGGITIIQDPEDADFPQMPLNVLEYVEVDHTMPVAAIGAFVGQLVNTTAPKSRKLTKGELSLLKMEVVIATRDNAFESGIMQYGELTPFTCPECHGALARLVQGNLIRFRCHTGHAYTASTLLADLSQSPAHRARIIHDSIFRQEQYSEDIRFQNHGLKKTKELKKRKKVSSP